MNISELLRAETSPSNETHGLAGKSPLPSLRVRLLIVAAALLPSSIAALLVFIPAYRSPAAMAMALPALCLSLLAVFVFIFIAQYRTLLDRIRSQNYTRHQDKVISLLLEDFDAGSRDWLWEANLRGELVYLSGRLSELTGRAPEQLLGRRLQAISGYPPHIRPWQSLQDRIDAREEIREIEVPVKLNKQRRWWQLSARPVYSAAGDFLGYRGVGRDTTEAHKAKAALVLAKESAERASAVKSQFLNVMSHELRTPLNAIIGFSEVMMQERFGPIGNERYRQYLKDIHTSGGHLVSLLNDLLDLSKIEAGKLELNFANVDLNELTQESVALMQPQANRERIIIRTALGSTLPAVTADARSVRQILLNLLSNSIKFTGMGGQVIVSTARSDDGDVVLRVRDTGVGMSEQDIAVAMEPFRQLATSSRWGSGGTGLGLPLTKALAEANRASFKIRSAVNTGTLVEVAFPGGRVAAE
jgi:PAS domain S-box-containing protein